MNIMPWMWIPLGIVAGLGIFAIGWALLGLRAGKRREPPRQIGKVHRCTGDYCHGKGHISNIDSIARCMGVTEKDENGNYICPKCEGKGYVGIVLTEYGRIMEELDEEFPGWTTDDWDERFRRRS